MRMIPPSTLWSLYRLYRTCNSHAVSLGLVWRAILRGGRSAHAVPGASRSLSRRRRKSQQLG
jgi:hypothetical protein